MSWLRNSEYALAMSDGWRDGWNHIRRDKWVYTTVEDQGDGQMTTVYAETFRRGHGAYEAGMLVTRPDGSSHLRMFYASDIEALKTMVEEEVAASLHRE